MSSGAFLTSTALKGRSLRGVRSSCQSCDIDAPLWQSYRLRKPSLLVSYCRWLVLGLTTLQRSCVAVCPAFYRHFVYINRSVLN